MKKANAAKLQVKKLMAKLDEGNNSNSLTVSIGKTGEINEGVFFQLLGVSNITLAKEDQDVLRDRFARNQKIRFKEALSRISIDITQEEPLEKPWIVRGGVGAESTLSMRSFLKSSGGSEKGRSERAPSLRSYALSVQTGAASIKTKKVNIDTIIEEKEEELEREKARALPASSEIASRIRSPVRASGSVGRQPQPPCLPAENLGINGVVKKESESVLSPAKGRRKPEGHERRFDIIVNREVERDSPEHFQTENMHRRALLEFPNYNAKHS